MARELKIALVHDYLREYGGAERVLEALHELYPKAPVYVGFVDWEALGAHAAKFKQWKIHETRITKLPFYKKLYSPYRIFAPSAFAALDLVEYDVVISSSNAYFAKNITTRDNAVHLCYCHTPPRALYGFSTMSDWKSNPFTRVIGSIMNHFLRVVDYYSAQKVDHFIANSQETAARITKYYRRDSTVINPPVALVDHATKKPMPLTARNYYLYVNRLALAKHPELAVAVATTLELPLKVVGSGKMLPRLKQLAGKSVEFLGAVSDAQLVELYAQAKALLYPVEDEDFGIVPVEAMAFGTPVIAHESGGPKETVVHGKNGILFTELTEAGLEEAVRVFQATTSRFDPEKIQKNAREYSPTVFAQKIAELVKATTR